MEETRVLLFALQAFVTLYMVSKKDDIFKALNEFKGRLSIWKSTELTSTNFAVESEWDQSNVYEFDFSEGCHRPDVYETEVIRDVEAPNSEKTESQE